MMQSRRMPLIQSVIMSRMFSIGYVLLAEQVRQQGDELHTDQGNTAARHDPYGLPLIPLLSRRKRRYSVTFLAQSGACPPDC